MFEKNYRWCENAGNNKIKNFYILHIFDQENHELINKMF